MAKNILYFSKEHGNNLPTVRIHNVVIENIKSVEYGSVSFACSKKFVPEGTVSDILGLYGQNGSGKTTLINVLQLIRMLMVGMSIKDPSETKLLSINSKFAKIQITFDLQYPNKIKRTVIYSFKLKSEQNKMNRIGVQDDLNNEKSSETIKIFDESIRCEGVIEGKKTKMQTIIAVNNKDGFCPKTKLKYFVKKGSSSNVRQDLSFIQKASYKDSQSAIFNYDFFDLCSKDKNDSDYFNIIKELMLFANQYLFVVDSYVNGAIRFNIALPIFTQFGIYEIQVERPTILPAKAMNRVKSEISNISSVLSMIIPGLELVICNERNTKNSQGKDAISFEVMSKRGKKIMPISYEADGIRKIIMYLPLIIASFRQKSTTVAIDELDAGVFEYLLGELLQLFQDYGKGQLIFTSHNLRPLEVLNKEFICFTTSNPKNRYIHMKNIGHSYNLRNTYFREIMIGGTQDESLYLNEQKFKILNAIKSAKGMF